MGRGCRCDAWLWCGAVVVTATAAVALLHRNPRLPQTRIPKEPNAAVAMRHTNGTNALQPEPGPPPTLYSLCSERMPLRKRGEQGKEKMSSPPPKVSGDRER